MAGHVLGDQDAGVYEQHRDLEHVRGLFGHTRIGMTPSTPRSGAALKYAVEFYAVKELDALSS